MFIMGQETDYYILAMFWIHGGTYDCPKTKIKSQGFNHKAT